MLAHLQEITRMKSWIAAAKAHREAQAANAQREQWAGPANPREVREEFRLRHHQAAALHGVAY